RRHHIIEFNGNHWRNTVVRIRIVGVTPARSCSGQKEHQAENKSAKIWNTEQAHLNCTLAGALHEPPGWAILAESRQILNTPSAGQSAGNCAGGGEFSGRLLSCNAGSGHAFSRKRMGQSVYLFPKLAGCLFSVLEFPCVFAKSYPGPD